MVLAIDPYHVGLLVETIHDRISDILEVIEYERHIRDFTVFGEVEIQEINKELSQRPNIESYTDSIAYVMRPHIQTHMTKCRESLFTILITDNASEEYVLSLRKIVNSLYRVDD